jgi:nicotinamidase-related amidase
MRRTLLSLIAISWMIAGPALAQEAVEGRPPSHCIALVENTPGFEVIRAAASDGAQAVDYRSVVPPETVRISYIDHSMFLIQTPGGLSVVTDYNGFLGPAELVPDVATMNHAHGTHWTAAPDPRIPHSWGAAFIEPIRRYTVARHTASPERVIEKHTFDGFYQTELLQFLRDRQVQTVVLAGVETHVCVLTTAQSAAINQFKTIILEDCVWTASEELDQRALAIFRDAFGVTARVTGII